MQAYPQMTAKEAFKTTMYAMLFCGALNVVGRQMWKEETAAIKQMTGYDLNKCIPEHLCPSSLGLNGAPTFKWE